MLKKIITILLISTVVTGCAKKPTKIHSTKVQDDLKELTPGPSYKEQAISPLRAQAIRDTALSIGARGALAKRADEINTSLLGYEKFLDRVFNFHGMLLDDNVLPPVLIEARKTLTLGGNSSDVIRIADRNYTILKQAKFVTAAPRWREYLWMNYSAPEKPDRTLLPKNKTEKILWDRYIDEGWQAGITQADIIFKENLSKLHRDMQGMINYRRLLAQNMVSPPYVASTNLGITGNGSNINVNDRVLRITAFPQLQTNGDKWKTELKPHE